jgi:hypothetical protein
MIREIRVQSGQRISRKKSNAVGASHPDRIVRGFLLALCHRGAAE